MVNFDPTRPETIERFARAWQRVGGSWEHQPDPISARLALLLRIREGGVHRVAAPAPQTLPIPGLTEAFRDANIVLVRPEERGPLEEVTLAVSGAHAGLAATGSLVFSPPSPRDWLVHILSGRQIVVLPTSELYPDMTAWRETWQKEGRAEACERALIVSGPSVSRDIELVPHFGMFGPRNIHVILFDDFD
ncbi:MAG: hypothetical protein GXP42_10210 [Chloroflexi bacterium]|nr:hypothetical protein [Chloroflexota bacterium]